jgi:hypothetical protein
MNEWQLQDKLTLSWILNPPLLDEKPFHLVAWELMFPSWRINEKKRNGMSHLLTLLLLTEIRPLHALS